MVSPAEEFSKATTEHRTKKKVLDTGWKAPPMEKLMASSSIKSLHKEIQGAMGIDLSQRKRPQQGVDAPEPSEEVGLMDVYFWWRALSLSLSFFPF